jgi:rRNA pseudouridine-1189 N-methylase Emg1 (Nep1/Mra1 family)
VKEKAEETKEEAGRLLGMGKETIGELVQEVKEKTVGLQERGEVMKEGAMKSAQEGREKAEEVREEVAGTAGEVKGKIEEGVEVGKEQAEEMRKKAEAEGLVADEEALKEAAAAGAS